MKVRTIISRIHLWMIKTVIGKKLGVLANMEIETNRYGGVELRAERFFILQNQFKQTPYDGDAIITLSGPHG